MTTKARPKKGSFTFSACDSAKGQIGLIWYIIHARDAQYHSKPEKSCSWNTYKRGMIALAKDRKPPDRHHLGHEKIRPLSRSCIFEVPINGKDLINVKHVRNKKSVTLQKKKKTLWEYLLKFIYSEKASRFCEIFTLLLSYGVPVKSKLIISQNFVAFSEYMNFTWKTSGRVDYFSETNKRGCSFIRNLR